MVMFFFIETNIKISKMCETFNVLLKQFFYFFGNVFIKTELIMLYI